MNQISLVLLYVTLFTFVYTERIDWKQLLTICAISSAVLFGLTLNYTSGSGTIVARTGRQLQTLLVFLAFGYGLSPIFRTLTETISTDTIYAMTTVMFLMHLIFHDYGVDAFVVSKSTSLNAALFAAVCLISRLPTEQHAFTLLALAVQLFAFLPSVTRQLASRHAHVQVCLATCLWPTVTFGLYHLATTAALLFGGAAVFVCLFCPMLLVKMQSWKSTIHGPWDEAVPQQRFHS